MRIIPRRQGHTPADDAIPPHATCAPRRPPIGRHLTEDLYLGEYTPRRLPAENPNLLVAYPDAPAPGPRRILAALAMASAAHRSACRILAVSLAQNLNEADLEFVIAQNLALFATSVNS